ncbi:hypothetical protein SAMN04487897_102517 [Paenibacillus sp. yr247]|uniref:hypothetical protein n=1 Tax=Paenibacillus sp. yr247 TaxID=1761880 RepID=UPI00088AEB1B|nr:hypothetical protein [Paenibacillus sp. yr247]SDN32656.1 hypothetical protein SAMN04487897_102517 [Paenibacillus sp. yr247]
MDNNVIKRRKFDLKHESSVHSLIKIIQINHKRIETKHTKVTLTETNSRGMRFLSSLDLPIDEKIIWNFRLLLREMPISAAGVLISVSKMDEGFEYEAEWIDGVELGRYILDFFMDPYPFISQAIQSYAYFNEHSQNKQNIDLLC